jgi:cell division protein FtsL
MRQSEETKKAQGWAFCKIMPLWVFPVLVVMAIGTVWLRLSIVRTSYSIDQMDRQLRALHQARQEMELKVTGLRSPRRLELLAKTRLNMAAPTPAQVIRMRTDDVIHEE